MIGIFGILLSLVIPVIATAVVLTLGTLFWEVSYPALVWPRLTRRLWIAMAVAVHLGIGLAMGMMEFGLAMITANLAFVPAGSWHAVLRFLTRRGTAAKTVRA